MDSESGIDPRLRDGVQSSQPPSEYLQSSVTTSNPIRLPPPSASAPYQHSPHSPQHPSPYQPWSPQEGGYANYPPHHQGQQAHPASSPNGYQHQPLLPGSGPPSAPQYVGSRTGEAKRLRACEACRNLKVRCEPAPNGGPCKRCTKSGKQCTTTAPTRKRQKKTDSRVAELEKRIDALTQQSADLQASLHASKDSPSVGGSGGDHYGDDSSIRYETPVHNNMRSELSTQHPPYPNSTTSPTSYRDPSEGRPYPHHHISKTAHMYEPLGSVVDTRSQMSISQRQQDLQTSTPSSIPKIASLRDSVDARLADTLLDHYVSNMMPKLPIVIFHPSMTADMLRREKPTLFGVVMCIAAMDYVPDLHRTLVRNILSDLAERIFALAECSLELLQSVQLMAVWHWQENNWFYSHLYSQITVTMSTWEGLTIFGRKSSHSAVPHDHPEALESARAGLACYYLASRSYIIGDEPISSQRISGLEGCKSIVQRSPIATGLDKLLLEIIDQYEVIIRFLSKAEDNPGNALQDLFSASEEMLTTLHAESKLPTKILNVTVSIVYAFETLQMSAVTHQPSPVPGKVARSRLAKGKTEQALTDHQRVARMIQECVDAALAILLNLPPQDLRKLPTRHYVDIAHLVISLSRLSLMPYSSQSDVRAGNVLSSAPSSVAAKYFDPLIEVLLRAETAQGLPQLYTPASTLLRFLHLRKKKYDALLAKVTQSNTEKPPDIQVEGPSSSSGSRGLHLLSEVATGNQDRGAAVENASMTGTAAAALAAAAMSSAGDPLGAKMQQLLGSKDQQIDNRLIEQIFVGIMDHPSQASAGPPFSTSVSTAPAPTSFSSTVAASGGTTGKREGP